jgi:hypothetical protein
LHQFIAEISEDREGEIKEWEGRKRRVENIGTIKQTYLVQERSDDNTWKVPSELSVIEPWVDLSLQEVVSVVVP